MKHYTFSNGEKQEKYEEALMAIEHGVDVTIKVFVELDRDTACKVAALGQPVFLDTWFWYCGVNDTLEHLTEFAPEDVVVNLHVNDRTIEDIYKIISNIEANPKLMKVKVSLIEPIMEEPTGYLSDQAWNELIVMCYDHNINLNWGAESAGYRYVNYLKETLVG